MIDFPLLTVGNKCVNYVSQFKYLGHIITNDLCEMMLTLNKRLEICLFAVYSRKFYKCSLDVNVKLTLFRSFCLCFYDIALWRH